MADSPDVVSGNDFKVIYEDDKRFVHCFCGERFAQSIVPHLRTKHPEVWQNWQRRFVNLRNTGCSYKGIMRHFTSAEGRLLFSWTVIEREIKKVIEESSETLMHNRKKVISSWEPTKFELERTTVWKFERRGDWAVHSGEYRGNWPPQLVRNILLRYSDEGDLVIDPFVGGGTTLIESWILSRASIGLDISPHAISTAQFKVNEMWTRSNNGTDFILRDELRPVVVQGDARNLVETVGRIAPEQQPALICAHLPYMDSVRYTETLENDLSHIGDIEAFCKEILRVASACHSVLALQGHCVILMGDIRKHGDIIPLGFRVMEKFTAAGFALKDIIIKEQYQDSSTEFYYRNKALRYLIAHEYLFIFQKS